MYAHQQLYSLIHHARLSSIASTPLVAGLKFFVLNDNGEEWDEVDSRKTPEQLGLKHETHVGIKLDK